MNLNTAFNTAQPRFNRIALRVLLALLVLAVAGNVAFFLFYNQQTGKQLLVPRQTRSGQVVQAVPLQGKSVLTATVDNKLELFQNGRVAYEARMNNVIGSIAVGPDDNTYYVGTSDGKVSVLNSQLKIQKTFQVSGRVVGLETTQDGGLLVAYGYGAYSNNYYVNFYPQVGGQAAFKRQADFTISALTVGEGQAFYGTQNSGVGAIDIGSPNGRVKWTTTVSHPVTVLRAVPATGQILVGEDNGSLALLTNQGASLGDVQVSQYPLRALAFDRSTHTFLVGDAQGTVYALNQAGSILLSQKVAGSDIEALLPIASGKLLVVPQTGQWFTLNPAAIGATRRIGKLSTWWYGFDGAMLVAVVVAVFFALRRLRAAMGRALRSAWRARLGYGFALPALALIIVFSYYPAASAVGYSLTNFSLRNVTEWVGLQNYVQVIFHDFYFRTGFLNMIIIVITSFLKTVTIPLLVAELIFWLRNRVHKYLFRTLFVLPAVVPGLVYTLLWQQVYDPRTGLLNELLGAVGLSELQHAWLGDSSTALAAIIGVGFPWVQAFAFLIFLGGLLNINPEYYDAATVDGANRWRRFQHIDLPLLRPQFRIMSFFAITGALEGFASIFILTGGGPGYSTYVPALQMYLRISSGDLGYASAIGVILFIIVVAATIFILRFRRQEIETA